jgi:hypothetical protein
MKYQVSCLLKLGVLIMILYGCGFSYNKEEKKLLKDMKNKSYPIDLKLSNFQDLSNVNDINQISLFIDSIGRYSVLKKNKIYKSCQGKLDVDLKRNYWIFKAENGKIQERGEFCIFLENTEKLCFKVNNGFNK